MQHLHMQQLQKMQQMQQQQQQQQHQQQHQQQQRQSVFHQQPILPKQQVQTQQQQQLANTQLPQKHLNQPQLAPQRVQQSSRGQPSLGGNNSPGSNVRMATSPRAPSPLSTTVHPGNLPASTQSSLPMYMPSTNYPAGVVSGNVNRPIMPSPVMYSTPSGQSSSSGYTMNQSLPQGMQYGTQRPGMPVIPKRPPMQNYPQQFTGPLIQPTAYNTQGFPDTSGYSAGYMSSTGSQHPPTTG